MWFDANAYCCNRLAGGNGMPWESPGDLAAFAGRAQGMFASDALLVDLADLYGAQVSERDDLRAAMAARPRPGFALRTLLADERARAVALNALVALASAGGATPVVLRLPSPARWIAVAAAGAHWDSECTGPVETEQAEAGAMYVADLLRTFAATAIAGLLLDEGSTPRAHLVDPDAYRAVLNVARNYGWPVFLRTEAAECWPLGRPAGVDGWIGRAPPADREARWGIDVPAAGWLDGARLPELGGGPAFVSVPADGDPVLVMRRVRELG